MICLNCRKKQKGQFCPDCRMPLALESGIILNEYVVESVIGQGGMGTIYRAISQKFDGALVAIKELCPPRLQNGEQQKLIDKFDQEAQILFQLHHPNLPRVIDSLTIGSRYYMVMDLIEGKSLRLLSNNGMISQDQIISYMIKVCEILEFLHSRQPPIIHLDVKAENILITASGEVFLVDFGIAKLICGTASIKTTCPFGTPGISSPWQYMGQISTHNDIYSSAATLLSLLTKKDLAENMITGVLQEIANGKLKNIIAKALARPEESYQSITALKNSLVDFQENPEEKEELSFYIKPIGVKNVEILQKLRDLDFLEKASISNILDQLLKDNNKDATIQIIIWTNYIHFAEQLYKLGKIDLVDKFAITIAEFYSEFFLELLKSNDLKDLETQIAFVRLYTRAFQLKQIYGRRPILLSIFDCALQPDSPKQQLTRIFVEGVNKESWDEWIRHTFVTCGDIIDYIFFTMIVIGIPSVITTIINNSIIRRQCDELREKIQSIILATNDIEYSSKLSNFLKSIYTRHDSGSNY